MNKIVAFQLDVIETALMAHYGHDEYAKVIVADTRKCFEVPGDARAIGLANKFMEAAQITGNPIFATIAGMVQVLALVNGDDNTLGNAKKALVTMAERAAATKAAQDKLTSLVKEAIAEDEELSKLTKDGKVVVKGNEVLN